MGTDAAPMGAGATSANVIAAVSAAIRLSRNAILGARASLTTATVGPDRAANGPRQLCVTVRRRSELVESTCKGVELGALSR
jgi:hypothetical protein